MHSKFQQGQIILNADYAIEFYPFLRTPKPKPFVPESEREAMLERIRSAKAELIAEGKTFPKVADERLRFLPTEAEAKDIILVMEGVLAEGRLDPLNIEPLISASLDEIESRLQLLYGLRSEAAGRA